MMRFFLMIPATMLWFHALSQGLIRIDADPSIERLSENYQTYFREADDLSGWRVQLLASSNRSQVEQVRAAFVRKYPQYKVDWEYTEPFYRLRVGAFASRLEANALLVQIRNDYPGAVLTRVSNLRTSDFLLRP